MNRCFKRKVRIMSMILMLVFPNDLFAKDREIDLDKALPVREIAQERAKAALIVGAFDGTISESGKKTAIPVQLSKEPLDTVIVHCDVADSSEAVFQQNQLRFEPHNWQSRQFCRIAGLDDETVDGDQTVEVSIYVISENDMAYRNLSPQLKELVNLDNDQPGVEFRTRLAETSESGQSTSVSVRLKSAPSAGVVLRLVSENPDEGAVSPDLLTFTPDNWHRWQRVRVIGEDDDIADGDRPYRIMARSIRSNDKSYQGFESEGIDLINRNNDIPGVEIAAPTLVTHEKGESARLDVRLSSQPTDSVMLSLSSSNSGEGDISPHQLLFNAENWNQTQSVRVFGKDDPVADGDQPFEVLISTRQSADQSYARLAHQIRSFTNIDDDSAGIRITNRNGMTTEGGGVSKIGLALQSKPIDDVVLRFESSNPEEGRVMLRSIKFSEEDWYLEKTLAVEGVDDAQLDGDQPYRILIARPDSADPEYARIEAEYVSMINRDNESAGLTIDRDSDIVDETGTSADIHLRLNARPAAQVIVSISSDDCSELAVAPEKIEFQAHEWNKARKVVVKGVADGLVDGDQTVALSLSVSSEDKVFQVNPVKISFMNRDINSCQIITRIERKQTAEWGEKALLRIKLNADPEGEVQLVIESEDTGEGSVTPGSLTFDRSNWQTYQHVEIIGVDDDQQDGDQTYRVVSRQQNQSPAAVKIEPAYMMMKNLDDDRAGLTVKVLSREVEESEASKVFSIALNSEPSSSVVFIFSSTDDTEGEMIDHHAAFFPDNWNQEQIIQVQGVEDFEMDGPQTFQIISEGAISKDKNYGGMRFAPIEMSCYDTDHPGFVLGPLQGEVTEEGGQAFFDLKLATIPKQAVKIALFSDDTAEGLVSPENLTFTEENWNKGHKITVTGVDDNEKDGNANFSISFSPSISRDEAYTHLQPEPVWVRNSDTKQMVVGLATSRLFFQDEIKEKLKHSLAVGMTGALVYSGDAELECSVFKLAASGSNRIEKYKVDNPMNYQLEYTGLMAGFRRIIWRGAVAASYSGGLEFVSWNLESSNELSGKHQSNGGVSMGAYAGVGSELTVYRPFLIMLDASYHLITRGLSNSQFALGMRYPF